MATAAEIQLLYIAYFGRPADPAGLTYWTTGSQASLTQEQVADYFAADREFLQTTVGKSTQEIINQYYLNLFGRPADAKGLAFWTAEVSNGISSIQDVGLKIALGAKPADKAVLDIKGLAASQWTALVAQDATAATRYTLSNSLSFTYGVDYLAAVTTTVPSVPVTQAIINGLPPTGTVGLIDNDAPVGGITEGTGVTFTITTVPELIGKQIAYQLTGVELSDLVPGQTLAGTLTVGATGKAVLNVSLAKDASIETGEILTIIFPGNSVFAKPPGSASVPIVDTTVPAASAILTTSQDISGVNIVAPVSGNFTYFANEETLGQSDQLSQAPGSTADATLNVGTQGNFNLINFSTNGIQTLFLRPSNEDLGDTGRVDLQAALGLLNINVEQSALGTLFFNDIQSAAGFTTRITDSFTDFEYNFDANALGGFNSINAIIAEAPIDSVSGQAVGLDFTQGPTRAEASIEALTLTSNGSNPLNVVDILSVGTALETLVINGTTSLEIIGDLGLPFNGNSRISLINAAALDGDLTFDYTSELGDPLLLNNDFFDVRVLGAVGDNDLFLGSTAFNPTDYWVVTQNGDDTVETVDGADTINVAEGDNLVFAGNGRNTVTSGAGDDTVVTGLDADIVTAGAGDNSVETLAGNDTVVTLGGDDVIKAGDGDDTVNAGDGDNTVWGDDTFEAGNDTIVTGSGDDFINADAFDFLGVVGAGNDSVIAGAGDDTVLAGSGSNTVDAGAGDDSVVLGETDIFGAIGDGFANTVALGEGNDVLTIDTDSLTVLDSINGGIGIDTIGLDNGGTILLSETLRTNQVEAFDLLGTGDYNVTLSNELVRSSDQFSPAGSRVFSVFTSDDVAGNVQLDLSFLTPVDAQGNLLSINYSGQNDTDRELVIIRDGLINDQTTLAFGEAPFDEDETFADVLQIVDTADVTKDDLLNVTGLEVIELASSVNGPQTFTIELPDLAGFDALVGDFNDTLIIRATPLLNNAVSTLFLKIDDPFVASRVLVEQSANLNVVFTGAFTAPVETALFYTSSADRLPKDAVVPGLPPFIRDGATVTAFQANDVQSFDFVNANEFGANETIEFRYAVSNPLASLEAQLNFTLISGIDLFRFVPAAVNQAVSFNGIGPAAFAAGLDSIETSGGDDRLVNIERNLSLITNDGDDTVTAAGVLTALVADLGSGADSFLGVDGNDVVTAGSGDDTVSTAGGNDFVNGGEGNDSILTGLGNDTVFDNDSNSGDNTIDTSDGDDEVFTGLGNDSILTGSGNDFVTDLGGDNTVLASLGFDGVTTGDGNDSINTAEGTEIEDDSVNSNGGQDTVLVGFGNDFVNAGADDVIVLASFFDEFEFELEDEPGGLSSGDNINGGAGFDSLLFAVDVDTTVAPNLPGQFSLASVENLVISALDDDVDVTLAREVAIQAGGTINVVFTDGDFGSDDGLLDASAFTSAERLVAGMTDMQGQSSIIGGAGADQLFTIGAPGSPTGLPFINSEVEGDYVYVGLGGADTINLLDEDFNFEAVGYLTANDGGNAGDGSSSSADLVTGFRQTRDSVAPFFNIEDLVFIGGSLKSDVLEAGAVAAGTNLSFAFNSAVDFDGLAVVDANRREGLIIGNGVSDSLLSNTVGIADRINGFGITSTTGKGGLIIVQGATESALYTFVEDGIQTNNASFNELYKLGTFSGQVYLGGIDTAGNLITTVNADFNSANFQFV